MIMDLRTKIDEKYTSALKLKDFDTVNTLRLIKSAIKDKDILKRSTSKNGITDSEILSLFPDSQSNPNDGYDNAAPYL